MHIFKGLRHFLRIPTYKISFFLKNVPLSSAVKITKYLAYPFVLGKYSHTSDSSLNRLIVFNRALDFFGRMQNPDFSFLH